MANPDTGAPPAGGAAELRLPPLPDDIVLSGDVERAIAWIRSWWAPRYARENLLSRFAQYHGLQLTQADYRRVYHWQNPYIQE